MNLEHLSDKLDNALEQETTESLTTWLLNKRTMEKIYVVKYKGGHWDDSYEMIIFATTNKSTADNYVKKFNTLLHKWKEYYSSFEDNEGWIQDKYTNQHFDRWYKLYNINNCFYEEVEIR